MSLVKMSKVFCILVNLLLIVPLFADETIVKTKYGCVQGTIGTSLHGRKFRAFNSIPYARPPVGALRLKPPAAPVPWNDKILNVSATPPYCPQPLHFPNPIPIKGKEDCLYLGVYVPQPSNNNTANVKLPVMMFIHGGGYAVGGGADYPPDYFMDKDNIIYVSINYRLGALGFLGGFGKELPGNFGLKDQSMALQWIHDNIEAFGGNPKNVTIFGQSVGSASVGLHAFNPLSKGLYHGAIMESATAISFGAVNNKENAQAMTISFAAVTGCLHKQNNPVQYLECFQALPLGEFLKALPKLPAWYPGTVAGGVFIPCIEGADVPGAALPRVPNEDAYITKDIPYIAGVNLGEGTFLAEFYRKDERLNMTTLEELGTDYQRLLPIVLALNSRSSFKQRFEIGEKIKQYYYGNDSITNTLTSAVILSQMFRDGIFVYSTIETLKQVQAFNVSTYMYLYSYRFDCESGRKCHDVEYGVDHGDEQIMFFPVVNPDNDTHTYDKFTPREVNVSATLIDYWTNFAINGDPNSDGAPVWTPFTLDAQKYLHITNDSYVIETNMFEEQYNFWKELMTKFDISFE